MATEELNKIFAHILNDVTRYVNNPNKIVGKILLTILIFVVFFGLKKMLRQIMDIVIKKPKVLNIVRIVISYVLNTVIVVLTIRVWMEATDSIMLATVLFLAFLSLSAKDLYIDVICWILIIYRKYFQIYDRIEINGIKGKVLKITPMSFNLMELGNWFTADSPTGRVVKIPNSWILKHSLYNYSDMSPVVWKENKYTLTFASDWQKAMEMMTGICDRYIERDVMPKIVAAEEAEKWLKGFELYDGKLQTRIDIETTDEGIVLKLHYPAFYTESTKIRTYLNDKILRAFDSFGKIEMAGNTLYIYQNKTKIV